MRKFPVDGGEVRLAESDSIWSVDLIYVDGSTRNLFMGLSPMRAELYYEALCVGYRLGRGQPHSQDEQDVESSEGDGS